MFFDTMSLCLTHHHVCEWFRLSMLGCCNSLAARVGVVKVPIDRKKGHEVKVAQFAVQVS